MVHEPMARHSQAQSMTIGACREERSRQFSEGARIAPGAGVCEKDFKRGDRVSGLDFDSPTQMHSGRDSEGTASIPHGLERVSTEVDEDLFQAAWVG